MTPRTPPIKRIAARLLAGARTHAALLAVVGLYLASALAVPTLAPVALSDDFLYARSVEILHSDLRLEILPATTVTLVFQVLWGGAVTAVFGFSYGVLRFGTVIFTALSALAVYGLCREVGVDRARAALGTALYLFNPLAYVLSFSFMTDSYFTGVTLIGTYFFVRGLAGDAVRTRWVMAGSVAATAGFLVRQQGIVLPLGVLTYLILSGRLRRDRSPLRLAAQVAALPAITAIGYFIWLQGVRGDRAYGYQDGYIEGWSSVAWDDVVLLLSRLALLLTVSVGFFLLPVGAAVLPSLRSLVRRTVTWQWAAFGAVVVLVAGTARWSRLPLRMPLVAGWVNDGGLGPKWDLRGGRLPLVGQTARAVLTIVLVATALVVVLALCRRLVTAPTGVDAGAAIVLSVLAWQVAGIAVPSLSHQYDRYFLPALPLVVVAGLWALRGVPINLGVAAVVTAAVAAVSVAGTHDWLTYQSAAWSVARSAHRDGVPYDKLDAGPAWNGAHLYEDAVASGVTEQDLLRKLAAELPEDFPRGPLLLSPNDVPPWWNSFFGLAVDNGYVVSAEPLAGFDVTDRVEYSSWLEDDPTYMYLLRHAGTVETRPGPADDGGGGGAPDGP